LSLSIPIKKKPYAFSCLQFHIKQRASILENTQLKFITFFSFSLFCFNGKERKTKQDTYTKHHKKKRKFTLLMKTIGLVGATTDEFND
jgi:hypothetical protein